MHVWHIDRVWGGSSWPRAVMAFSAPGAARRLQAPASREPSRAHSPRRSGLSGRLCAAEDKGEPAASTARGALWLGSIYHSGLPNTMSAVKVSNLCCASSISLSSERISVVCAKCAVSAVAVPAERPSAVAKA